MIYKYIFKTLKNIENRENRENREKNYKVNFCINIRDNGIQCKAIKKNGKQCKQMGKERQTGGIIINGYCTYHKHLR